MRREAGWAMGLVLIVGALLLSSGRIGSEDGEQLPFAALPPTGGVGGGLPSESKVPSPRTPLSMPGRPGAGLSKGGLPPVEARTPSHTDVRGRVLEMRTGGPVADAKVFVCGRAARTDDDGRFSIAGVVLPPEGEAWIGVSAEGWVPSVSYRTTADLVSGREMTVWLEPAVPVSGRVVDDAGAPLAGALVGLVDWVEVLELATTDGDGRFRLAGAASDSNLLRVWPPEEGFWDPAPAQWIDGGSDDVEFVLRRAPPVDCRVVLELVDPADGTLLDEAEVELLPTGDTAALNPPLPVPRAEVPERPLFPGSERTE